MDMSEGSSQLPNENKRGRKNVMWTLDMEKCLVKTLVFQANEGLKIDKGFKEHAYTAHPDAKGLRGKSIELLDESTIICGTYQATRQWVRTPRAVNSQRQSDTIEQDVTRSSGVGPSQKSGKQTTHSRNTKLLNNTLGKVATTMGEIATAIKLSHNIVDEDEMSQIVDEMEGLDDTTRVLALEYLNDNPTNAKTFMKLKTDAKRSFFLFRHLSDFIERRS
ncbi:hypothetical protein HHK36_020452 [Tetracentron sinense]|uniref:Uncharacterized protein n=1 Tax=Tetracentron sinense TaxID=13715 RepID=A0A834YVF3_TETSI|nr:hypothetical protein HHK36_020452 [Tetracentron sinense]